jgi:hypothetical protein
MYVVLAFHSRGLVRAVLAELEHTAVAAGYRRVMLETGQPRPKAIS